jgi:hypothetical protein
METKWRCAKCGRRSVPVARKRYGPRPLALLIGILTLGLCLPSALAPRVSYHCRHCGERLA